MYTFIHSDNNVLQMNIQSIIKSTSILLSHDIPCNVINIIIEYCIKICDKCYSTTKCDVCNKCMRCTGGDSYLCQSCYHDGWYYCAKHHRLNNDELHVHCIWCFR